MEKLCTVGTSHESGVVAAWLWFRFLPRDGLDGLVEALPTYYGRSRLVFFFEKEKLCGGRVSRLVIRYLSGPNFVQY